MNDGNPKTLTKLVLTLGLLVTFWMVGCKSNTSTVQPSPTVTTSDPNVTVETNSVEVAPEPVSTNVVSVISPLTNVLSKVFNVGVGTNSYYSYNGTAWEPMPGSQSLDTNTQTYLQELFKTNGGLNGSQPDPAPPSHVRKIIKRDQDAVGVPK